MTAPKRRGHVPLGAWPRVLSRDESAAYLGLSLSNFVRGIALGVWPEPIRYGSRRLWDIRDLDEAFDCLKASEARLEDSWAEGLKNVGKDGKRK